MKFALTLLIAFTLALSSCGIHLQKRLYRNGFYISTNSHRETESATPGETVNAMQYTSVSVVPDTTIEETDQLAIINASHPDSSAAPNADTIHADEQHPVSEPAVALHREESPPEAVPAAEMESVRQLYVASIAVLIAWLILSPISTIASLVLALVVLKRIRMLKEMYSPTDNQQTQLEKYRSFEVIALIASIVALALTILVLALFLAFFFGVMSFGFI